jgi:hypothetical protein
MTRLSCGVPVVISRWKLRNARQLPSVLWIFATSVPGVAWKRSGPLRTKRAELCGCRSLRTVGSRVLCTSKSNHDGEALTEFLKSARWPSLVIRERKERLISF